jgi:prepilin peptidase CpaA
MVFHEFSLLAPTLLLLIASGFDVKSGRFPNWLFVSSAFLSLLFLGSTKTSVIPVLSSLLGSVAFFIALTPLFFFGVLGAGDLKLLAVFCLLTSPLISLSVLAYSLFWGLLIGLLKLMFAGQLITFAQSLILRNPQTSQQKIPFTVALLLGWLSYLSLGGVV